MADSEKVSSLPSVVEEQTGFTEAELLAGDLEREQRREQRFKETLAVVHELELAMLRRLGLL